MLPNSSIVYLFPMDLLQLAHIGRRLSISRVPPFDSGRLCPTSNLNGVMMFSHQLTKHLCLNNLSPQYVIHTCSRRAPGILAFISTQLFFSLRAFCEKGRLSQSAPSRDRTCDIKVNSLTLYRLSYRSKVSLVRFELTTFGT